MMFGWFRRLFRAAPAPPPLELPSRETLTPPPLNWGNALEALRKRGATAKDREPRQNEPFVGLPVPPPFVRPPGDPVEKSDQRATQMAFDTGYITGPPGGDTATTINVGLFNWATGGLWGEGLFFPGYPYLAELSQRPEYRHMVETLAEEMTRKWLKLRTRGREDKAALIEKLEAADTRLHCRHVWRRAIELDGYMGMGMIYVDIKGVWDNPEELKTPLLLTPGKIAKGSLDGFVPIDPTWVSPVNYNAINPLRPDFFVPTTWYVMGREVHASRLLIIRQREVPDILKPSYNFGGISISQLAKPYVDNWLRTRQSVSDLLHSFTVFVLKTTMQTFLQDATAFATRIQAFILGRDNKGLFVVDKETEDFANVSASLAGLDHLQSQAQEQMGSVSKEPLVKLLGITPTGLNASSDGEIRVFYDHIHAEQERSPTHTFARALDIIQLSETGAIDPDIRIEWLPLWELDEAGRAAVQKTQADTDDVLITAGVLDPAESRGRLATDLESPYHGLEGPPPDPPDIPDEPNDRDEATNQIDRQASEGATWGANSGDAALSFDTWEEGKHPRGQPENAGQFGPGGGSKSQMHATRTEGGKRVHESGAPLPAHIEKLKIPPAWTDVRFSNDPDASLLVVGKDAKGRTQSIYSEAFTATQAAAKFARIHELSQKFHYIAEQNEQAMRSDNPRVADSAACLDLIMKMGIRPGSDDDTGAKVKAYGATTLEGRHVVEEGGRVTLKFVGKKGVSLSLPVEDERLSRSLVERAKKAGPDGKLFPMTNDKTLLDHTHTLDGGGFKTKDFRTHLGTMTAYGLVAGTKPPESEQEYKKRVMEVAKRVAQKLGNTPVVALQSYISPTVFAEWRMHHA